MKTSRLNKFASKLLNFANLHLFITLISMPILISWGLPISLLSPLGNFIFNPLLTGFLLLSSLIFFTEMLHIPNGILIWPLEQITNIWNYALRFECNEALCGFKTPPFIILLFIPLITFGFVAYIHNVRHRTLGLSILFVLSWCTIRMTTQEKTVVSSLPCNNATVAIFHHNGKTVLVDPGAIGQRISAPSWVAYTLIPEITKLTGSLTIDYLIITKPGLVTFEAIETLCKKITVKHIYLPYMDGEMDTHMKKKFYWLYRFLKQHAISFSRIGNQDISIVIDNAHITITPSKKNNYRSISYYQSHVSACVDNQPVPLYDSKKSTS